MKLMFIVFSFLLVKDGNAQVYSSVSDSAEMYLAGILVPYNPAKAFQLFVNRAQNGEAKAMNAVGMMYQKGMGVDSSFSEAYFWFRQAAINGYTKAWVNLGMLYKRYNYDSTGYAKANLYFDTALIYQEPSAYFAKGYMLYKGLGGSQDYTSALYFFRLGNGLNRADCMYFTGLCFKYGYGINVNADSATFYIDKAARLGYRPANAERYFNLTKDSTVFVSKASGINREVAINPVHVQSPKPFKSISYSPRYIQLSGNYAGTFIQYDYSGNYILAEVPVALNVTATGIGMKGVWYQGNQEPVLLEAHQSGNHFTFTSASFLTATIKSKKKRLPLIFRSLRVEIETRGDSVYLTGTVQLYNTYTREPEKPLNVKFAKKKEIPAPVPVLTAGLLLYPNPVANGDFSISFNLIKEGAVTLTVLDAAGGKVFTQVTPILSEGRQSLKLKRFKLPAGYYILNFRSGKQQESIAFVTK